MLNLLHTKVRTCVMLCVLLTFTQCILAIGGNTYKRQIQHTLINSTRVNKVNELQQQDEVECNRFHYRTTCLANAQCNWCCNAPFGSQCFRASDNHTSTLRNASQVINDNRIRCDEVATLRQANETCAMACARAGPVCQSCELLSWCYYCRANHSCQSPEMSCVGSSIVQECSVQYDDSDSAQFAKRLFLISSLLITAALLIFTITRVVKYVTERSDESNTSAASANTNDNNNNNNHHANHVNSTTTTTPPGQPNSHSVYTNPPQRQPLLSAIDEEESSAMLAAGNGNTNSHTISNTNTTMLNSSRQVHLTLANTQNTNLLNLASSPNNNNNNNNTMHLPDSAPMNRVNIIDNANEPLSQISANMSHLPHVSSSVIDEDHMCYLCLAARSTVTFLPCHHMCCCQSCSNRLRPNEQTLHCPFCRQKIDAMVSLPNIFM